VARSTSRRAARVLVLSACTLAVAGLFAAVVRQSWAMNSAAAGIVRVESQGAAILHGMTTLVGELVEAQSAAVRGEKVDGESIRKAVAEIEEEDGEYGPVLQTHQRLTDLSAAVESALARADTGHAAYETYSGLVTLAVDMIHQVGDVSHLIHDPDIDSFYLMDAAIIRLPDAIVLAGRAADLVALAAGNELRGEDAVRAAVARFGVSAAAEQVSNGLRKSVDFTASPDLSSHIAERLDAFRAAADAFAPPTMLAQLADTVDPKVLAANARRVYATANPLAHRLLGELQTLLDKRTARLQGERRFTTVSAGLAALAGLVMLWLLALIRRRPGRADGAAGTSGETAAADDVRIGSLRYARELLDAEELVHVGRAVGKRSGERDDAR